MARTAVWAAALGALTFAAGYLLGARTDDPASTHAANSGVAADADVASGAPAPQVPASSEAQPAAEPASREVDRLREEIAALEIQLDRQREDADRLLGARQQSFEAQIASRNERIEKLRAELRVDRPQLEVDFHPSKDLLEISASGWNPGRTPISIVSADGRLWFDGERADSVPVARVASVLPKRRAHFYRYYLFQRDAGMALAGEIELLVSLCFVYAYETPRDGRRWRGLFWAEYQSTHRFRILDYDFRPAPSPDAACDLDREAPPPRS